MATGPYGEDVVGPVSSPVPPPRDPGSGGSGLPSDDPLRQRPLLSIRARIIFSFLVIFVVYLFLNLWSFWFVHRIEQKIEFLEVADMFMAEIQEARRYEKNYLLYGTDVEIAIHHLSVARTILDENEAKVRPVLGRSGYDTTEAHLSSYRQLLDRLAEEQPPRDLETVEHELREHGGLLVDSAQTLALSEREDVDLMLRLIKRGPFLFIVIMMLAIFLDRKSVV